MMSEQNDLRNGVSSCGEPTRTNNSDADNLEKKSAPVQRATCANSARQVNQAATAATTDAARKSKAQAKSATAVSAVRRQDASQGRVKMGQAKTGRTAGQRGKTGRKGVFQGVGMPFQAVNRKLDVFRKNEVSAIITNTILGGIVVIAILCVFFLLKPGIDSVRAGILASAGEVDQAIGIVNALERRAYPEEKLNQTRVAVAQGLISSGNHEWATSVIAEIPAGAEKTELEKKQSYARASALYDSGDYTGAAQIFYQLSDYGDAQSRYADIRCVLAIQAWQAGNETSARSLLLGVPDLVTHVSNAAIKVTGDEAAAQEILGSELFNESNLTEMEQTMAELSVARSEMPEGKIAAGWGHTVVLKNDGTVLAVGDNSKKQCDVGSWKDIIRVAAGAYHTVGLRADGTVVATGNDTLGQCDVSEWTDIIAVAAGTADTIGLKSDGSVVAAGKNANKVSGWHGATFVTAGSYSMGCIFDNGSMLSSHKGAQMDMGVSLHDLSVCGPVSVGVLYDGSLVSSFEGAPQWENIVTATACESGILAIDVDGKVLTHFYNEGSVVDISVPGRAVAIESSGTHHVVLTEDGGVYAFGNNDYGQCNVG